MNWEATPLNTAPDASFNDSHYFQRLSEKTVRDKKAVGTIAFSTALEMISYIRELEKRCCKYGAQPSCFDCGIESVDTCPECNKSFCATCVEADETCCDR